jgi:exosortase
MTTATPVSRRLAVVWSLGLPFVVLVWAYWTTLADMASVWAHNSSYSHGYMVPVFAGFLLWFRRGMLNLDQLKPSLFGIVLLTFAVVMRLAGTYYFYAWLDPLSLVPAVAGVVLLVCGWHGLRWAWPASLFLFFMIPLPYTLSYQMSGPLQQFATICSTFLLQTIGMPALAEGNTILINDGSIGVVEACSGLRMLMVFYALSCGVALVIRRPWLEKVILVVSAIPIALAVNILRITVTGVLHECVSSDMANTFFHDVAGWFMMPMALGMLWCEYHLLTRIFLPEEASLTSSQPSPRRVAQPSQSARARPITPPARRKPHRPATPSSPSPSAANNS